MTIRFFIVHVLCLREKCLAAKAEQVARLPSYTAGVKLYEANENREITANVLVRNFQTGHHYQDFSLFLEKETQAFARLGYVVRSYENVKAK